MAKKDQFRFLPILFQALQFSVLVSLLFYILFFMGDDFILRTDFLSFYTAAGMIKSGHPKLLYSLSEQNYFQKNLLPNKMLSEPLLPFRNPPVLALVFIPFTFFPIHLSYRLMVLINTFLLLIAAKLLFAEFKKTDRRLVSGLVFLFFPAIMAVILGQVSVLLLIFSILIYRTLKANKEYLTGVLTSFFFIKPQFLIIAPFIFLLAKSKKKFLSSFVLSLFLLILTSVFLVGGEGLALYPKFLLETEQAYYSSDIKSQMTLVSFFAYLLNSIKVSKIYLYSINLFFFFLFFLNFWKSYAKVDLKKSYSYALLISLACSFHAWEHELVLTLIPFFFLLENVFLKSRINKKWGMVLTILLYGAWTFRFTTYPFLVSIVLIIVAWFFLKPKKLVFDWC